jgi:hypothetical protein
MQTISTRRVVVEPGGDQVAAHVGLHALGAFADQLGLRVALSARIPRTGKLKGVISRSCGAALVFVDETTKTRLADHHARRALNSAGRLGWRQVETSVGSVPVVVLDVLLENGS